MFQYRISEFSKKATIETQLTPQHKGLAFKFDKEKFAEALVNECVKIVENTKSNTGQLSSEEALNTAITNIKQYFGIA